VLGTPRLRVQDFSKRGEAQEGCGDQLECRWHSSFAKQWNTDMQCRVSARLFNLSDFNESILTKDLLRLDF